MNLTIRRMAHSGRWLLSLGLAACSAQEPAAEKALKPADGAALAAAETTPAAQATPATSPASKAVESGNFNALLDTYAGKKFNRGLKSSKKVALTFDDGPHPKFTPPIVEILQRENVPATFFWLGKMVKENPQTAQLVVDGGFEIGTHSWGHPKLSGARTETVRKEVLEPQDLVEQMIGKRPRLFRPPYGAIGGALTEVCREDGLVICMWSLDTLDWDKRRSTEKMVDVAINDARNGDVILLHDIQPRTVANLEKIIKGLKARGFEFVTMGELIAEKAANPEADAEEGGAAAPEAPAGPMVIPLNKTKAQ